MVEKVWYVNDEGIPGESTLVNGLSMVGLFANKEIAINYVQEYVDSAIKWQQDITENLFIGHNEKGRRYILSLEIVIND